MYSKATHSIFACIVDVLAIVPVAGSDVLTLDGDGSRPSSTAAWAGVSNTYPSLRGYGGTNISLTSTVRYDVEGWGRDAFGTAVLCEK